TGSECVIVLPSLRKADITVRAAANDGRIFVVLPVILPKANGADFIATALGQREVSAARARDGGSFGRKVETGAHVFGGDGERQLVAEDRPTVRPARKARGY
ncbi:MAG: hypothetical protein ABIQ82_09705, partial [Variovorax sp.]